jgi:hypothetical protein
MKRKLTSEYDPTKKVGAMTAIARAAEKGEVLTGLLDLSSAAEDLHAHLIPIGRRSTSLARKSCTRGQDAGEDQRRVALRPPSQQSKEFRLGAQLWLC